MQWERETEGALKQRVNIQLCQTNSSLLYIPFVSLSQQQTGACLTPGGGDIKDFPTAITSSDSVCDQTCHIYRKCFHWMLGSAGCNITYGLLTEVETIFNTVNSFYSGQGKTAFILSVIQMYNMHKESKLSSTFYYLLFRPGTVDLQRTVGLFRLLVWKHTYVALISSR